MVRSENWQPHAIEELAALLEPDEDVLALAVGGSAARAVDELDAWSDVDALIIVRDHALARYFPALAWLADLGRVFAYEHHIHDYTRTLRVCFDDFRRFDFVFMAESSLAQAGDWPPSIVWRRRQVLFVRSDRVEPALDQTPDQFTPVVIPQDEFETLVNGFWFKGVVAMGKIVRGDWPVALHLCLALMQDCLLMAMLLRDRDAAEGRADSDWSGVNGDLHAPHDMRTAGDLLDSLAQSAVVFDRLAMQWSVDYRPRADRYQAWLEHTWMALDQAGA